MKLYLENMSVLDGNNPSWHCRKSDYVRGQINETFDSLQYLHLKSHELLYDDDLKASHHVEDDGYYQKTICGDQKRMALDVLQRIKPFHYDTIDFFVYCHASFSEDLGTCTPTWLLSQCGWQAKTLFTVQHHGGLTLALGLIEMFHLIKMGHKNCKGVVVGAEKIVLPYRRYDFPLAWLSDGAVAFTVTTQPTQNVAYEVVSYDVLYDESEFPWFRASRDFVLTKTVGLFKRFLCLHKMEGHIVFPSFDDDVIARFVSSYGRPCGQSKMGAYVFGLDCFMALNALPDDKKNITLIFIDPLNALACIQLKKIVL